jgi:excinuclease ABC subunit B
MSQEFLAELEAEMLQAAENLEFERAAQLRDRIMRMKWHGSRTVEDGPSMTSSPSSLDKLKPRGRKGRRNGQGRVPRPRNVDQ